MFLYDTLLSRGNINFDISGQRILIELLFYKVNIIKLENLYKSKR